MNEQDFVNEELVAMKVLLDLSPDDLLAYAKAASSEFGVGEILQQMAQFLASRPDVIEPEQPATSSSGAKV